VETTSEKSSGSFLPKKLCIVDLNINLFKINKNNFLPSIFFVSIKASFLASFF
jgi:hypothetical protein